MNRIFKCAAIAAAVSIFAATSARAANITPADDNESYGFTPIVFGIGTPISIPLGFNWDCYGVDLNFIYSDINEMRGLMVGGLGNTVRGNMYGLQAALGFNYNLSKAYGLQCAVANVNNMPFCGLSVSGVAIAPSICGASVSGLCSFIQDDTCGAGISGFVNVSGAELCGAQIAFGANFAHEVKGAQIAMFFNETDSLTGAQIGLVNYTKVCNQGLQFGLINVIMDNYIKVTPIVNFYF